VVVSAVQESVQKKRIQQVFIKSAKELGNTFVVFAKAPKALWGINAPYVIEGLVYFGILTILGKFCSENVVLSDLHAGWVYGAVTGGITFAMLLFGGLSDKIGVRRSLAIALFVMMIGRFLVSLSGTIPLGNGIDSPMFMLMLIGLLFMVSAYGLYQPAAYAGVKQYTNPKTAAMGYAVIYGLMNLGAFLSGFVSPATRHHFEDIFPPNGLTAVFWVYTFFTFISFLITILILSKKTDQEAVERIGNESIQNKNSKNQQNKPNKATQPPSQEKINNTMLIMLGIILLLFIIYFIRQLIAGESRNIYYLVLVIVVLLVVTTWEFLRKRPEHPFRDMRFVFFIFILVPVQTLFAHNWLTIPYYLDRAFVGTIVGEYFEFFSNLNPILIFILAPIIAAITSRANVYKMMIVGTFIMAMPTFLLVIGPNTFFFLIYIFIMTIGEAMWQPRFLQWIAEIAPEGRTGAYMGIGQFPWFLTKLITASYSGYFIANYVPQPDSGLPQKTGEMWFFYAIIAMISPITLLLAKKWMMTSMKKSAKKSTS
jgi:POT family proton-dependent oligopeptide transporter